MKLLEASVKAATDTKAEGAKEPVSVADAKKAREKRPAAAKKPAAAKAAAKADDEAEEAEADPRGAARARSLASQSPAVNAFVTGRSWRAARGHSIAAGDRSLRTVATAVEPDFVDWWRYARSRAVDACR